MKRASGSFEVSVKPLANAPFLKEDGSADPLLGRFLLTKKFSGDLDASARMLESLSHKSVLARGFVMVHREDGTLVRAAKDLNAGDAINLTFADDQKKAVVDPPEPAKPRPKPKPGGDQGSLF